MMKIMEIILVVLVIAMGALAVWTEYGGKERDDKKDEMTTEDSTKAKREQE